MFWRKKQKEQIRTEKQTSAKTEQTLDKEARIKELLCHPIYHKIYLQFNALENKEWFLDFFALAELLEQQFNFILENKAKPLETVSAMENLKFEPRQRIYFYIFLSFLLQDYAKKHFDGDVMATHAVLLTAANKYLEQEEKLSEAKENETSALKKENETSALKKENELLWKKREHLEILKIDLEIEVATIESIKKAEIQRLLERKKYLEGKIKEAGLTLPDETQEKHESKQKKEKQSYPPFYLQQILDTAVRLYEKDDKVRAIDIYQELRIEKNTYNKRIKFFGYNTAMILQQARDKFRESEAQKSSKKY